MGDKVQMNVYGKPYGDPIEFPDNFTDEQKLAYIDEFERIAEKGTSEFLRPGESAPMDDPEGVSTAGMGVGTDAGRAEAFQKFANVPTLGMQDEAIAGVRSMLPGGESYAIEKAKQLAQEKAFEYIQPVTSASAEIVGSLYLPGTTMKTPFLDKIIKDLSPMKKAMTKSGIAGSIYGGMEAENDELIEALKGGGISSALSMPMYVTSNAIFRFKQLGQRAEENRKASLELESLTTRAYKEATESGQMPDIGETQGMLLKITDAMEKAGFRMGTYGSTSKRIYKQIQENFKGTQNQGYKKGTPMTWQELDDMRKDMWTDWATAKRAGKDRDKNAILAGIRALDEAIDAVPGKGQQFRNARELWKKKQRADIFDTQIEKASEKSGVFGSGGNRANKIIQAVEKIKESNTLSSFYTPEQIEAMNMLVKSYGGKRLKRSLSKLAPNGNGLMLFLQAYGAYAIDPTVLSSMFIGTEMQRQMESFAQKGAQKILSQDILGMPPVGNRPEVGGIARTIDPAGNRVLERLDEDLPSVGRRGAIGGANIQNGNAEEAMQGLFNFLAP